MTEVSKTDYVETVIMSNDSKILFSTLNKNLPTFPFKQIICLHTQLVKARQSYTWASTNVIEDYSQRGLQPCKSWFSLRALWEEGSI